VTRDDNFGQSATPFGALVDPGDGFAGVRVAKNRLIPFLNQAVLGQERIGSTLTIGVDPRAGQSSTVFLAWAEQDSASFYTIHLVKSIDRGQTWSTELLKLPLSTNPAVAVNDDGKVAVVYQQLTGSFRAGRVTAANRWVTHFRISTDGGSHFDDTILATTPANLPRTTMLPYLGDYLHLMSVGKDGCAWPTSAHQRPQLPDVHTRPCPGLVPVS
jgi:hypothetical protein